MYLTYWKEEERDLMRHGLGLGLFYQSGELGKTNFNGFPFLKSIWLLFLKDILKGIKRDFMRQGLSRSSSLVKPKTALHWMDC